MDRYFATYTGVKQYMTDVVDKAREQGYVETLWHRRRALPELKSSNFNMRSFGERVALNMPIQGTAADIIKAAMVRVDARMRAEKLQARLLLQVHGGGHHQAGHGPGSQPPGPGGPGGPADHAGPR